MKKLRLFVLLLVVAVISPQQFFGQANPSYTAITVALQGAANVTPGSFNLPAVGKTLIQATQLRERNKSARMNFKLDLGNDYIKTNVNWTFTVQVDLTYQMGANTPVSKTLIIDQNKPELLKIDNVLSTVNSSISISPVAVNITSVGITATDPLLLSFINSSLRLTTTLEREYDVDVRLQNGLMSNAPVISPVSITGRIVTFSWQPVGVDAYPNYEIQILKLYNVDPALQTNTNSIATDVDWNRALKVETQNFAGGVRLTMAEGTGYYMWRVRPVGAYFKDGIANIENYGEWSYALPSSSTTTTFNKAALVSPGNPTPYAFYFTDPDENINWIYSRVFTEGDNMYKANPTGQKTSEGITYANGLLMTRQSQKYNSSENTNIVSQTQIDYSGRPSLTTIPVPVAGNLSGYKIGFVKNSLGALYTAANFDEDNKVNNPDQVQAGTNNPFAYYSSTTTIPNGIDNTNVADAEGYPYKRTIFKTDGTNRVAEESGVGKAHSLGLQINGQGHTTRVLYGTPSEDELIRVFGDEAPLANSVIKTITMDQNNVVSVTYTSKEGKTIATALISDNAPNMLALKQAASTVTVTNSITENISNGGKLVASKRIAIPDNNTLVKLSYINNALPGNSGTVCPTGDCGLRMRFFLTDLNQGITYMSVTNSTATPYFTPAPNFTLPAGWQFVSQSTVTPGTITPTGTNFDEISLNFGEYIFTKEIYSGNASTYAEDLVNIQNDKIKPVIDALVAQMQQVKSEATYNAFVALTNTLITEMTNYNNNNIFTPAASLPLFNILKMDVNTLPVNYIFPPASEFTLAPLTTNTVDPSVSNLEIVTGCCGSIKTAIPGKPICYLCDGSPDPAYSSTTTIAAMVTANNNLSILITPYGLNDFIAEPTWTTLTNDAKVAAITGLVEREMITPLKEKMNEEGYNVATDLWKITPGFSYESLNSMFANMLISQYYTGVAIQHTVDNKWYAATYNSATGGYSLSVPVNSLTNIPYNYDCSKLFDAWRSAIELINGFETGSDDNILGSFNSDNTYGSGQDNSESQDNWLLDLAIIKQYLKKAMSKHLEDFNDSSDGKLSGARKESSTSVINDFMKDAGFQFAAIIDGTNLPDYIGTGTSPLPNGYSSFSIAPVGPAGIYTTITTGATTNYSVPLLFQTNGTLAPVTYTWDCTTIGGPVTANELYYPYILKPEWMFKYYVYNVYENKLTGYIDDNDLLLPNQVSLDIQRKYNLPYSYLPAAIAATTTPNQLCSTPSALTYSVGGNSYSFNFLHNNWSSSDRLSFYNAIKGGPKCYSSKGIPFGDALFNPPGPTCSTKQEMYDLVIKDLDDRIADCAGKFNAIKSALTNELTSSCYTIVPCKTGSGAGQVTEKEIDLMAAAVVKDAEDQIKYVKTQFTVAITNTTNTTACANPSLFVQSYGNGACDLPSCSEVYCKEIVLYNTNDLTVNDSKNIYTKLYRTCDEKILEMISSGTFLPYVAPYGSCNKPAKVWTSCPDGPECSTGHPYKEKTPCSQTEYNAYSKKFTVQATGN